VHLVNSARRAATYELDRPVATNAFRAWSAASPASVSASANRLFSVSTRDRSMRMRSVSVSFNRLRGISSRLATTVNQPAGDQDTPLRATRLLGDGTRTVTVGWADLLYEQIAGPARERWLRKDVEEYPQDVTDTVARLYTLLPRLVEWLIQRYIEQTVTSGMADNFEEVLASRGLAPPPEPEDPPAIVFVDISGYTTVTEARGDDIAVRIATTLQRRADQVAADRGGRVVKLLGDGAMLHFRDVSAAVQAATELVWTSALTSGCRPTPGCTPAGSSSETVTCSAGP
jgi:class 3 adenylate cyclase